MAFLCLVQCARHRRRQMYYWAGTFVCVVGVLLLLLLVTRTFGGDQRLVPSFVGGYCAIFATLMSLFQILEHLTCFADPECQTKTVRILFMVPLFAIISWLSLLAPGAARYLNLVRDTYESYVIYAFFQLMIAHMGGMDALYRALMIEARPPLAHFFPLCYLEPVKVTPTFVQNCRLCLFQFMVVKPLVTIAVVVLTAKHAMGDSLTDWRKGAFWTTLTYNVSITVAFTALLYFYTALKDFIEAKNPLMKFLCIKAVIFLSFWQGLLIQILATVHLLPTFVYWSAADTPTALQDLLICVEMMFVAFAHKYCFGSDEYVTSDRAEAAAATAATTTGAADAMPSTYGSAATAVVVAGDDGASDDAASTQGILQAHTIPPIRYSVSENLKYTLRHEDILRDMRDIMRNR